MFDENVASKAEAETRAAACISMGEIPGLVHVYFGEGYGSAVKANDGLVLEFRTVSGFPVDPENPGSVERATSCDICKEVVGYSRAEGTWYFSPVHARVSFPSRRTDFIALRTRADVQGFLTKYLPLSAQPKKEIVDESAQWKAAEDAIRSRLDSACHSALYAAFADMKKIPPAHMTLKVADLQKIVCASVDGSSSIWQSVQRGTLQASGLVSVLDRVVHAMAR